MSENKLIRKVQYKLYPNKAQVASLVQLLIHHHQLYNFTLKDRIETYKEFGYGLSYCDQWSITKQYRDRRKAHGLFNANAQSEQNTLKRVDRAFKNFFSRLSKGQKGGFPRLKAFSRFKGWGYNSHGDGWKLHLNPKKHGAVYLADVGIVKMRGQARNEGGVPKTAEVIKRHDGWYISVSYQYDSIDRDSGTGAVALDWGLEYYATFVNNKGEVEQLENPRHLKKALNRIKELQRLRALTKKGSRQYRYLSKRITAVHAKVATQRKQFIHDETARIVDNNGLIAYEKLSVKNMTGSARGTLAQPGKNVKQKSGLNRSILDTAPATFFNQLKRKAEEAGVIVMVAPTRKLKPSQRCPVCSTVTKKTLNERQHNCSSCGHTAPRDVASAQVVLNWALEEIGLGTQPKEA